MGAPTPEPYWRTFRDVDGNDHQMQDGWVIDHDGLRSWAPTIEACRGMYDRLLSAREARDA